MYTNIIVHGYDDGTSSESCRMPLFNLRSVRESITCEYQRTRTAHGQNIMGDDIQATYSLEVCILKSSAMFTSGHRRSLLEHTATFVCADILVSLSITLGDIMVVQSPRHSWISLTRVDFPVPPGPYKMSPLDVVTGSIKDIPITHMSVKDLHDNPT